jgi:hypothetical protein
MILVLDACTISNLLNAYQNDSLIRQLHKCFSEIYIAKEVISEVEANKFAYLHLYESRQEIRELISQVKLSEYISSLDTDKHECLSFTRRFASKKGLQFNESDGEFQSSLLSLYLSRWGKDEVFENNNKILLATDDARAELQYQKLFSSNQIGAIIDSVDLIVIFHIRGLLTKPQLLSYVDSIRNLYNSGLNELRKELVTVKKRESGSSKNQLLLSNLIELLSDNKLTDLQQTVSEGEYKKIYKHHGKLKENIKNVSRFNMEKKLRYLNERRSEIIDDLIWGIKK